MPAKICPIYRRNGDNQIISSNPSLHITRCNFAEYPNSVQTLVTISNMHSAIITRCYCI